jgi:hypothetical protein
VHWNVQQRFGCGEFADHCHHSVDAAVPASILLTRGCAAGVEGRSQQSLDVGSGRRLHALVRLGCPVRVAIQHGSLSGESSGG